MGPKVESVVEFLRSGGREAVITSFEHLCDAVTGRAGTHTLGDAQRAGRARLLQDLEVPVLRYSHASFASTSQAAGRKVNATLSHAVEARRRVAAVHGAAADGAVRPLAADGAHRRRAAARWITRTASWPASSTSRRRARAFRLRRPCTGWAAACFPPSMRARSRRRSKASRSKIPFASSAATAT